MKSFAIAVLAAALMLPALPAEATNLGRHLSGARSHFGVSSFRTFGSSGFRGNFRLGARQKSFRTGKGLRRGSRASYRQSGQFNQRGGLRRGVTRYPGGTGIYGGTGYYGTYGQPPLTLTRDQLFFQRYLNERAQSKREILGTKDSTLELNRDLFGGNLLNPNTRGATGGTFATPFALPSVQTGTLSSATATASPATAAAVASPSGSRTAQQKPRTPLRRQLRKTDPVRGVVSPIPLTQQQKARIDF